MARPLRLDFAGALYHITSRGDRREAIYRDDDERRLWLDVLGPGRPGSKTGVSSHIPTLLRRFLNDGEPGRSGTCCSCARHSDASGPKMSGKKACPTYLTIEICEDCENTKIKVIDVMEGEWDVYFSHAEAEIKNLIDVVPSALKRGPQQVCALVACRANSREPKP